MKTNPSLSKKNKGTLRKIPATMVTQHPDNASKPYWHYKTYISSQYEAEEAYRSFAELGVTEYKWDWEGKLVDESVAERFLGEHFEYFSKNILGTDLFLTFRLPNPRVETEFRLLRAFINMASTAAVAKHFGFKRPPIFEVILPLTESAEEMLSLQEAYVQIHNLDHPLFKLDGFLTNIQVIPLFESVTTIIDSDKIIEKYVSMYKKRFKDALSYMRPYFARSDPALNSGIIPTVLSIKIALSRYKELSRKTRMSFFPIIGTGSLPFRGGLNPDRVTDFVKEYKGIRTVTLQSGFRYDYSLEKVKKAVSFLENELPLHDANEVSKEEEKKLIKLIFEAEKYYKSLVPHIAPLINQVATFIPQRRERFLHVGLFGYSRGDGKVKLPRAISFTCALYSIGIPPEFIGTGKAIEYAIKTNTLALLEKYYVNLKKDLAEAGRFLNKKNLQQLAKKDKAWQEVLENVELVEKYLGSEFAPTTDVEKRHALLTEKILESLDTKQGVSQYIKQAGVLRKSLG